MLSGGQTRRGWLSRRGLVRGGGLVGAASLFVFASLAPAQADYQMTEGSAEASATVLGVNIPYAGANIGLSVGHAEASYFENTSKASAITFDPAFLRLAQVLQVCGESPVPLPDPTTADTNANGGQPDAHSKAAAPGLGSEEAAAEPGSHSAGRATNATFGIPGAVEVTGGQATSDARLDVGHLTRTVTAETTSGAVSLLGGLVKIAGARWYVQQVVTGADDRSHTVNNASTFAVSGLSLAGVPLSSTTPDQLKASVATINSLTRRYGLEVRLPELRSSGRDGLEYTPMTVAIGGDTVYGPAIYPLIAGPSNTSLINLFNSIAEPTVFDPAKCNELFGLLRQSPALNQLVNTVGFDAPIILSAFASALNGGAELDFDIGGVRTSFDDTYYAPRAIPPRVPPTTTPTKPAAEAPDAEPAPTASASLATAPTETFASRTTESCSTTSPVGRPRCWKGAAAIAATAGALVTLALVVTDELWRRRLLRASANGGT